MRSLLLATAGLALVHGAKADPTVVKGNAAYSVDGTVQTVTQTSARAVLEWTDLSVAAGQTLRFSQLDANANPNRNAITLNRVTGSLVSTLDGTLTADGQVWILNPNGVLVGPTGQVTAAGFLATTATLAMSDDDFINEANNSFQFVNGTAAPITNQGVIETANGYALLLGGLVANETQGSNPDAVIRATLGKVALGSGTAFTVDLVGDHLISFAVDAASSAGLPVAGILNTGKLIADGGSVLMTARVAQSVIDNVINTSGLVEAQSAVDHDGEIVLDAGDAGIAISGQVDARGTTDGTHGGTITVTGGTINAGTASDRALLDASGKTGGGEIALQAHELDLASLDASAALLGNSGTAGRFSVTAAALDVIDPALPNAASVGVSQIAAGLVSSLLGGGADVSLEANGGDTGDLTVSAPISKLAGDPSALSLLATHDIIVAPGADITAQPRLDISLHADTDQNSTGEIRLGANIDTGGLADGLQATRYVGYFNDNFAFFDTASVFSDPVRFGNPFTAINTTTPGANFADFYSVRYLGYFRPATSGAYTFQSISDDASYIFLGNAGEAVSSLQSRITQPNDAGVLVRDGGLHGMRAASGTTDLAGGALYPLVVLFGENGGGDAIVVNFGLSGGPLTNNGLGAYFHKGAGGHINLLGDVVLTGDVSLGASVLDAGTIRGGSNTLSLEIAESGTISGDITAASLVKDGAGALTLQGNNAALQSVTVNHGTLAVADALALGSGPLTLGDGTLEVTPTADVILANAINLTGDSQLRLVGDHALDLASNIDGAHELKILADGDLLLNGLVGGTTRLAALDAMATGTLTLGTGFAASTTQDIRLGAATRFVNLAAGAGVLDSQAGRWLVWSGNVQPFDADPTVADQVGDLMHDFRYFGISENQARGLAALPSLPGGNGLGYGITPTVTVSTTATFSRIYDGTTTASLDNVGFDVTGASNGDTVSATAGAAAFNSKDTDATQVDITSLQLSAVDANGKAVYGYAPVSDTVEAPGSITQRALTLSFVGTAQRSYDGTTQAPLTADNFSLGNLVSGESISVTQTSGTYAGKDVGSGISVSTSLAAGDFAAGAGTLLSNYTLPTTDALSNTIGSITPRTLSVSLTGSTSRDYDGTTQAPLTADNFSLGNLVSGESIGITQTSGTYAGKNVGSGISVSASLAAGDFTAGAGTALSNYTLPTSASGTIGAITQRTLTVALAGSATRNYDGTTQAPLTTANFLLDNVVSGERISVTQTSGTYAGKDVGSGMVVTTSLAAGDFAAGAGTSLSNYTLPTTDTLTGAIGNITPRPLFYLADPIQRETGQPNPAFSGTVQGFVDGESLSNATSGTLAFDSAATTASPAGRYAITGSGLTATNYVFQQAPGNATALQITDGIEEQLAAAAASPAVQNVVNVVSSITQSLVVQTPAPSIAPEPTAPSTGTAGDSGGSSDAAGNQDSESSATEPGASDSSTASAAPDSTSSGSSQSSGTPATSTSGNGPNGAGEGSEGGAAPAATVVVAIPETPVAPTPPSPVPAKAPPTPVDAEDHNDPILQVATVPASGIRQLASPPGPTQLAPGLTLAPGTAPPARNESPPAPSMDAVMGAGS